MWERRERKEENKCGEVVECFFSVVFVIEGEQVGIKPENRSIGATIK